LAFGPDVPNVRAASERNPDAHRNQRRCFDQQFRQPILTDERLDQESVERLRRILAKRREDDRGRDNGEPDRKNGRSKRPELRSAAARVESKQL
jgi:hypothetical protein